MSWLKEYENSSSLSYACLDGCLESWESSSCNLIPKYWNWLYMRFSLEIAKKIIVEPKIVAQSLDLQLKKKKIQKECKIKLINSKLRKLN